MTQSWCYYTIFVTQYGLLHAAKRRYHERITEVRQDYDVVLVSEHAYQLSTHHYSPSLLPPTQSPHAEKKNTPHSSSPPSSLFPMTPTPTWLLTCWN